MSRHERRANAAKLRTRIKQVKKIIAKAGGKLKPAPSPTPTPIQAAGKAPQLLAVTRPVQIAAAAGEAGTPRKFEIDVYTGEPMRIYPWEFPVVIDLDTLDLSAQAIPFLYDHMAYDPCSIVGQITKQAVVDGVHKAYGQFVVNQSVPLDRRYAEQVLAAADAGYQWQASIGGEPSIVVDVPAGQNIQVNGRSYAGPIHVAKGVKPREVSAVILGGDRNAKTVLARARGRARSNQPPQPLTPIKGTAMSFEDWLVSLGFADQSSLDEVQLANLRMMHQEKYPDSGDPATTEGESEDPPIEDDDPPPTNARGRGPRLKAKRQPVAARTPVDIAADMRRDAANELARQSDLRQYVQACGVTEVEIQDNGKPKKVDLLQHAIAANWNRGQVAEAAIAHVRNERGSGPAPIVRSQDRDQTIEALQGGLLLRAGGKLDSKSYAGRRAVAMNLPAWLRASLNSDQRQRAMERAHEYSGLTALEIAAEALRLDGKHAPRDKHEMVRASFSGGSLTSIFTSSVLAILLDTYEQSADTTQGWVTEIDVPNFKSNERPRMAKGPDLKKLPRGAEAEHYSRSDLVETYKIARYAKKMTIDEQDFYDDDLGALDNMPVEMGDAAARLRPDLVYARLLANSALGADSIALFHSSHSNLNTTSALSATTLKVAIAALEKMRENGVNLNLRASHVLVPSDLKHLAAELIRSSTILYGGDDEAIRGSENTLKSIESLTMVSDARLSNGVTDPSNDTAQSGSTSTWFVAAAMAHTIEVGYLRGTGRAPKVRPYTLSEGKWGMGWDVNMDIGVCVKDYRGLQKNTA